MVLEFIKLGATVIGWDISVRGLDKTKLLLDPEDQKNKWHSYVVDLSVREDVYKTAQKASVIGSKISLKTFIALLENFKRE